MEFDPIFLKNFRLKTKITYLLESIIETGKEKQFLLAWKRAYTKIHPCPALSTTRKKQFEAYFRRLNIDGDDTYYTQRVEIKYISKKVGYGVFAKNDISSYSILGHYTGIFRPEKSLDPDNDSTFSFNEFKSFSIDAKNNGNWTRFMNHVLGTHINVIAWEYYTKEGPFIVFTSGNKKIKKAEQLLYSYGEHYWHEKNFTELTR
jgi:hypothetical protein